jgi:hypothetical protein
MLKGDLSSTPLAPLLVDLADDSSTGCLNITESGGEEALVYYKNGLVYAVSVPGTRPQLGAKLVSSGALAPEALAEALEAQRSELQGWRLGELLVHLGYVDQPVVEAFVKEQVSEALWDLMRWPDGQWKFRKNIKAREDVGPPMVVVELLQTLRDRGYEWETISAVVHGPAAIPVLSTRNDSSVETTLDNDAWSMLCKIDGERSVADLARDCGYTLFEAGHVMVSLVQAGLVDIDEDIDVAAGEPHRAGALSSALNAGYDESTETIDMDVDEDSISKLARLVTEVTSDHTNGNGNGSGLHPAPAAEPSHVGAGSSQSNPMVVPLHRQSNESFAASMARVSNALAEVLGDSTLDGDGREEMEQAQYARVRTKSNALETADPEWQQRKRAREAASAELATAQALVEHMRPGQRTAENAPEFTGEIPKVVSTETERRRADEREAEQARRHAAELEARAAAEQFAQAAAQEADRHADEQEVKRLAAVQAALHADADAAEQAAADQAAQEAARLQAERDAAAEDARAEYAQREEAARQAAEETQRLAAEAAEQLAAEQAAAEAERLAAEEAARLAAEEAECLAAKAAAEHERELAAEAERLAAEEIERTALAIEAERLATHAAAEQERQAAADAAAEQERLAVEAAEHERAAAETTRLAAEAAAEAATEAAEQARLAAEAAELAAEQQRQDAAEAERVAAEISELSEAQEAEHAAAEAKAERAAQRKADKQAAEEAAQREDEAAAATALLVELAASADSEPTADEPEPVPVEQTADRFDRAEADEEPAETWNESGMADTAALLRELSSLGVDDGPPRGESPPPPNRAPRAPTPDKKVKKKIGLFGL